MIRDAVLGLDPFTVFVVIWALGVISFFSDWGEKAGSEFLQTVEAFSMYASIILVPGIILGLLLRAC